MKMAETLYMNVKEVNTQGWSFDDRPVYKYDNKLYVQDSYEIGWIIPAEFNVDSRILEGWSRQLLTTEECLGDSMKIRVTGSVTTKRGEINFFRVCRK